MFQFFIIKRLFHQRLTGIKVAVDSDGMNISAKRTEQFFLQRADFAARIQNHHTNIFQTVERMCHCRTGITGGRGQNSHRLIARYLSQDLRHEAATEIFKGQGRAVEQFQTGNVVFYFGNGCREGKRIFYTLI
ncbi:hypothetical protein SRABI106_00323 [Rahnella aquatilis]|nr:hypothetical protein SRABI106_00323 [Rahnella aquatilis]